MLIPSKELSLQEIQCSRFALFLFLEVPNTKVYLGDQFTKYWRPLILTEQDQESFDFNNQIQKVQKKNEGISSI